jgi:Ca-activated chloride channel family protein
MAFVQSVYCKITVVFCVLVLQGIVALAQTPAATPAQSNSSGGDNAQSIVKLNLIITDEAGRSVNDVRREDVRVTEDGVAQAITYFAQDERPIGYGLVVDTTGSLRVLLTPVIEAGLSIVRKNRPDDETFVMHYTDSETIEIDEGWTNSRAALEAALEDLFIQGGLTATLDAMHRALTFALRPRSSDDKTDRRLALVLITDGEDRGSRQSNPEALLSRLRESEVQVFVIGLTKMVKEIREREKAVSLLTRIAQESGGRAFFPKSESEIEEAVKELTQTLRSQYVVGYNPTSEKRNGSFRKVQVTLAPGKSKRNVITRGGYNAPPR